MASLTSASSSNLVRRYAHWHGAVETQIYLALAYASPFPLIQIRMLTRYQTYISYIIQLILTWVFGPLFILVWWSLERWKISLESQEHLLKLQNTFLDVTACFTIPVVIAAVVRLHQSPPFFEIAFLQSLTTMQFLGLLGTALASYMVVSSKDKRRIAVITLYLIVDFSFYMAIVAYLHTSKASWTTIQQLGTTCRAYGSILPGFVYTSTHSIPPLGISRFNQSLNPFNPDGWIIAGFILAIIVGLLVLGGLLYLLYLMFSSQRPRYYSPMSLAFAFGALYCTTQIARKRSVMKSVTGREFEDNHWGIGQVIAISLWVPLVIRILWYLFGKSRSSLVDLMGTAIAEFTLPSYSALHVFA